MAKRSFKRTSQTAQREQQPSEDTQQATRRRRRRRNGEGTISQRADGRWQVQISVGGGKRKSLYGKTEKEVRLKMKEAQKLLDQGRSISTSKQTLREYLHYWLSVHQLAVKPSTLVTYTAQIQANILPALGAYQLQKLTTASIQQFIGAMASKGLKPGSIHGAYAILKMALADAVKWDLLPRNPCEHVTLPRKEKRSIHILDQAQAQCLLQAVKGHKLECLITVALATGLRRGELLGLHWQDINFTKKQLHVQRTLNFINKSGHQESRPKTASSERVIVLPQFVIDALMQHRTRQLEQRSQARSWQELDLVFPNAKGGYQSFANLRTMFNQQLKKAGLPSMRFHDLRHSAASMLLMMNVPPKVVQEILGHSNIRMTMDTYGHVLPGMHVEAMNKMNSLLASSAP